MPRFVLRGASQSQPKLDDLDLRILEILFDNSRIPFRKLARSVRSDEKTVARRVARLSDMGVIKRFTLEVDYLKLGLTAMAYIGTRTTVDAYVRTKVTEEASVREKLFEFFKSEPRIMRAEATIGANEYVFLAIDKDILSLRENVNTRLEPITAGLLTSIVSKTIRPPDYPLLMKLIRETTGIEPEKAKRQQK